MLRYTGEGCQTGQGCDGQDDRGNQQDHQTQPAAIELHEEYNGGLAPSLWRRRDRFSPWLGRKRSRSANRK